VLLGMLEAARLIIQDKVRSSYKEVSTPVFTPVKPEVAVPQFNPDLVVGPIREAKEP
jgi:hypothetical protein